MTRRKKTKEEYISDVTKKNPTIEVIGSYVGHRIKIKHKHICGHVWETEPHSVLAGKGCPNCATNTKKTHSDYVNDLLIRKSNIEVIGTYVTNSTKIKHRHNCGYEWEVTPNAILKGGGCPNCSTAGFKPNKAGTFYYFKVIYDGVEVIKYGITNNFKRRIEKHKMNLKKIGATIIGQVTRIDIDNGYNILIAEDTIKQHFAGKASIPVEGFIVEVIPANQIDNFENYLKTLLK